MSSSSSSSSSSISLSKGVFTNLTLSCNAECGCRHDEFQPVCSDDRVTYLNPCHAGCQLPPGKFDNDDPVITAPHFSNCTCTSSGIAYPGTCVSVPLPDSSLPSFLPCAALVGYLLVFLVSMLAFFLTRMTIINVCIRAAGDDKRGLALGLRSFLGNIMGNFTSSVLFGVIIDDSCVLWRKEMESLGRDAAAAAATAGWGMGGGVDCVLAPMEAGDDGDCLVYASTRIHFLTHGFAGILDLIGVGFFFLAYFLARNQPWAAKQQTVNHSATSSATATTATTTNSAISPPATAVASAATSIAKDSIDSNGMNSNNEEKA